MIPTNNCPTVFLRHPKKRNIAIFGDFNGSIQVYEINFIEKSYSIKFACESDTKYHLAPIINMEWFPCKINKKSKMVCLKDIRELLQIRQYFFMGCFKQNEISYQKI